MLRIDIVGLPYRTNKVGSSCDWERELSQLSTDIIQAVSQKGDASVYILQELVKTKHHTISAEIKGSLDQREREPENLVKIRVAVGRCIHQFAKINELAPVDIQVFVGAIVNPEDCATGCVARD